MKPEEGTKLLSEGILNGMTRIIIETGEAQPRTIATITADDVEPADGFQVRMRPMNITAYGNHQSGNLEITNPVIWKSPLPCKCYETRTAVQ